MKLRKTLICKARSPVSIRDRSRAGFTLAEVLAALLFMAIVIPVALEGLRVASRAGQVAQQKESALWVADQLLNQSLLMTNLNQSLQSGTLIEGPHQYNWTLRDEAWNQATTNLLTSTAAMGLGAAAQPTVNQLDANQILMNLLTVVVTYTVQGQDYSVHLSTLVSAQQ